MLKNLLTSTFAAVAIAASALPASAVITPGERIYVVGDFEDSSWQFNQTPAVLTPTSPGVYSGFVYLNNGEHYFRFYTQLGNGNIGSIGSSNELENPYDNVEVDFSSKTFNGNFYESQNCWHIYNEDGSRLGLVKCTLDFNTSAVRFESIDNLDGQFYFVSGNIDEAGTAPNNFDYSSIAYDGDLYFHFEYVENNGNSYRFGPKTIYNVEGEPFSDGALEMGADNAWGNFSFAPSQFLYTLQGCTSGNPINLELQTSECRLKIKRSSFDPSQQVFEWIENPVTRKIPVVWEELKWWLNIGEGLEVTDYAISEGDIEGVRIENGNLIVEEYASPCVFHITAYSNIEGKTAETEVRLLSQYPEAFAFFNPQTSALEEGMVINRLEDRPGIYRARLAVPAGEGDYCFTLTDPENTGMYQFCGDLNFNGTNAFSSLLEGNWNWLRIPESLRGETLTFEIDTNNRNIRVYQNEVPFFWTESRLSRTAPAYEDLRVYLIVGDGLEITGFTISEGDIEGVRIEDNFYLIADDTAPASTFHVVAHSNVEGTTAEIEINLKSKYPASLGVINAYDESTPDNMTVNPVENRSGVYEGEITIPEGDGDFYFMLCDPTDTYRRFGGPFEFNGTSGRGQVWDGNWEVMTIPASYRGQAFTFRIDLTKSRIEVYQGENPFVLTINAAEGNPEYAVANRETYFYFNITPADTWFNMETGADGIYADFYGYENGLGKVRIFSERWAVNDVKSFELIFRDGDTEVARFPMEARYVTIESISAPEEIVVHVGEHVQYAFEQVPQSSSEDCQIDFNAGTPYSFSMSQYYDRKDENSSDVLFGILGLREGEGVIGIRPSESSNYLAYTRVTVLPKEAAVAEHIFHAQMADGETLSLKLSDHSACSGSDINWTSSNEDVASVDANGMVSAISTGNAVITADCGKHRMMMGIAVNAGADVEQINADALRIYGHKGTIYVSGAKPGAPIRIVTADGIVETSAESKGSLDKFNVGSGVHIVNVGDEVLKLAM